MPLTIIRHDMTKLNVDAIVNASNPMLLPGAGVTEAIFRAAGYDSMQQACEPLAPIEPGQAVLTPGFNLPAKFVIHTVGPFYIDGKHGEAQVLEAAYFNSLELARAQGCQSIAFPLISNGVYQYPASEVLVTALSVIQAYVEKHELSVTLVVYDSKAFHISQTLLGSIESYIDEVYVDEQAYNLPAHPSRKAMVLSQASMMRDFTTRTDDRKGLDDLFDHLDESFSSAVLRLIDERQLKDTEVYKKANLSRQQFSKIRSNIHYVPSKATAVALAIALELSLPETENLLRKAGLALSSSDKFDVLIMYFLSHGMYNIYEINEILFHYDQVLLGSKVSIVS